MSFETIIKGNSNTYKIEVLNDISAAVATSASIQIRLYQLVAGSFQPVTSFRPDSILTNNKGISFFVASKMTQDYAKMGVRLYVQGSTKVKSLIDGSITDSYRYTEIIPYLYKYPSNVIVDSYFCSELDGSGVLNLSVLQSPEMVASEITTAGAFQSSTTYQIAFDIGKLFIGETSNQVAKITFMTGVDTSTLLPNYKTTTCNVLYNLDNIDILKDIEEILNRGGEFNYQFNPVSVNGDGVYVQEQDENGNPITLRFNVEQQLEDLFIKQFLVEYESYFQAIQNQGKASADYIKSLKKMLLKHSSLINASYKGNMKGMATILNIFCEATGYHLLSLEPSPSLHNFKYRITTSLPRDFWAGDIKDIIHPLSWKDEYVYVPMESGNNNLYFSLDHKAKVRGKEQPRSYLDVANIEHYHLYPTVFDLSEFGDYHTQKKFNFHVNDYNGNVAGYSNPALLSQLDAPANFTLTAPVINSIQNVVTVGASYGFLGAALEYEFQIKVRGQLYQRIFTPHPKFKLDVPFSAEGFTVGLVLHNGEFAHAVPDLSSPTTANLLDHSYLFKKEQIDPNTLRITYLVDQFVDYIWTVNSKVINTGEANHIEIDLKTDPTGPVGLRITSGDGYTKALTTTVWI